MRNFNTTRIAYLSMKWLTNSWKKRSSRGLSIFEIHKWILEVLYHKTVHTTIRVNLIIGKSAKHQVLSMVLTPDMRNSIHHICLIKRNFPELEENLYVFTLKGIQKHHIWGNKSFEYITKKLGLQNITFGKLRKMAAMNAQFEADLRRRKLLVITCLYMPMVM